MTLQAFAMCMVTLTIARIGPTDDTEGKIAATVDRWGGRATRNESDPARPVTFVSLRGLEVTAETLKELAGLRKLRWLSLNEAHVTGAALKELAGLKQLKVLSLCGT